MHPKRRVHTWAQFERHGPCDADGRTGVDVEPEVLDPHDSTLSGSVGIAHGLAHELRSARVSDHWKGDGGATHSLAVAADVAVGQWH